MLSPEQQQIANAKQLSMNRPVDDVLEILRALSEFDQETAARRKKAGTLLGWSVAGTIVGLILSLVAATKGFEQIYVVVGLTLAAAVTAIVSGVTYARLNKADLSDDLTDSAIPFLTLLREDMNSGDALQVKIDLRSAALNEKKVRETRPENPRFTKVIERLFVSPWFSGNVVLADGTRVAWEVIDKLLQRQRTKRNPRGKYKTKTKEKWHIVGAVTLGFPTKLYTVSDATEDEKRHTVKLKRKIKTDTKGSSAFGVLVDLIAEAYSSVAVAKRS